MRGGLHNGEMDFFPASADLGWRRSGLRARRKRGEPGSALLGRLNDFLAALGVSEEPGL